TERDHHTVLDAADAMITEATEAIAASIDTSAYTRPVVVFNSLSHDRAEIIEVADGDGSMLLPVRVPPMGYAVYDLADPTPSPDEPAFATSTELANGILTVTFDDDGLITSIVDQAAGREVVAPGGRANLFQLSDDRPVNWDAWDL